METSTVTNTTATTVDNRTIRSVLLAAPWALFLKHPKDDVLVRYTR